jgi:hypothetical protein
MKNTYNNQQGFILVTSILVMSLLLLMSLYVVNFAVTEVKISTSQSSAAKTYYLAESGIAEAIWKLKNDATWKDSFETNPVWTTTFTRDPAIYTNGSYQIQITNTGAAKGDITVTAFLDVGGSVAQRVVKTSIYKALGDAPVDNNAEIADGNIDISGSLLNVYNGGVFANGNIIVNLWSTLNVDDNVEATGNINEHWTSTINATAIIENADPIPLPAISFDDVSDPNSYINLADNIYTEQEFSDLMLANQNLTINGITYVTGDIDIQGDQTLVINGALISDDDIEVGKNSFFCCWEGRCGRSDVTINQVSSSTPAGLIAKDKIYFELCLDSFDATGLIYANDQINILSLPNNLDIVGGIISRKLTLTSLWQGVNLTYNNDVLVSTLGDPAFSPIVTVEHWEEEY